MEFLRHIHTTEQVVEEFPAGFPRAIRQLLGTPIPSWGLDGFQERTVYMLLTVQAAAELRELASLLRCRQDRTAGALAGSPFVQEALAQRGETMESLRSLLMGEIGVDPNDVFDFENNNNTD